MHRKRIIIGAFLVSSIATLSAIFFARNNFNAVNAYFDEVWYHYLAVKQTEFVHGSKEFWASSSNKCQTFVFEEPSEGQIVNRDFSTNPYFNELTFDDARYIPSDFEDRNAVYPIAIGDGYFKYGIYPDTVVSDLKLISALDDLEQNGGVDLRNGWYLYDGSYYTNIMTNPTSSGATYHKGGLIPQNAKNWFKCSPISWRELEDVNGNKLLLAEDLLDVIKYDDSSSDYMTSNIRSWLNGDFYDKAFALGNKYLKPTLTNDNIPQETAPETDYDNVFLLTYQNYTNQNYGFKSDPSVADSKRAGRTTDFTRASGAHLSNNAAYYGQYFTRTPSILVPNTNAYHINDEGQMYGYTVDDNFSGVRPAITINFNIN